MRQDAGTVDLSPLAELIERQARELAEMREAAAEWQIRAPQPEATPEAHTVSPEALAETLLP